MFIKFFDHNPVGKPLNLYGAIEKLLAIKDSDVGGDVRVTRFGYLGASGIAREERKPRGDVRSDPTHVAALAASDGDPIAAYDIQLAFNSSLLPKSPAIILELHGTETLARNERPTLVEMKITKCLYEEEFRRLASEVYQRVL
jgi:hypothetical protein